MPSTSSPAAERRARIERLDRLAQALDSKFPLPGTSLRIGWDGIIGLIPGFGDLVTAGPGALMAYEGVPDGRAQACACRDRAQYRRRHDHRRGEYPIFGRHLRPCSSSPIAETSRS